MPFLLDPASQRGVTPSVIPHPDAVSRKSSGRRARKIHSFYVPLWPASQRGVTCRSYRTLMRYPGKARAGVSARYIPFTSLSGPASQRWVTLSVIPHPDAVSMKSSGRRARRIHSLLRSSLDPASQRGVTYWSYRTSIRYPPGMPCGGLRLSVLPVVLDVQTGDESRKSGKSQYICPP